jgi:hypothetical protein
MPRAKELWNPSGANPRGVRLLSSIFPFRSARSVPDQQF